MYWHRTAVEVRNSDWSSDVCSSVLGKLHRPHPGLEAGVAGEHAHPGGHVVPGGGVEHVLAAVGADAGFGCRRGAAQFEAGAFARAGALVATTQFLKRHLRSEEHTSELQSLLRNSYAVFCLKKKTPTQ